MDRAYDILVESWTRPTFYDWSRVSGTRLPYSWHILPRSGWSRVLRTVSQRSTVQSTIGFTGGRRLQGCRHVSQMQYTTSTILKTLHFAFIFIWEPFFSFLSSFFLFLFFRYAFIFPLPSSFLSSSPISYFFFLSSSFLFLTHSSSQFQISSSSLHLSFSPLHLFSSNFILPSNFKFSIPLFTFPLLFCSSIFHFRHKGIFF